MGAVSLIAWGDSGAVQTAPDLSLDDIAQLVHVVDPNAPVLECPVMTLSYLRTHVLAQRARYVLDRKNGAPWPAERLDSLQHSIVECYAESLPIWTTGYAGWRTWAALDAAMKRDEPLVVDIRLTPWSQQADYKRETLEKRLGERYVHLPEWGNLNYKTKGPIKIKNFEGGLRKLIQMTPLRPVVLMCGCLDYGSCHRSEIAYLLDQHGWNCQEYSIARYGLVNTTREPSKPVLDFTDWRARKKHNEAYLEAVKRREKEFAA